MQILIAIRAMTATWLRTLSARLLPARRLRPVPVQKVRHLQRRPPTRSLLLAGISFLSALSAGQLRAQTTLGFDPPDLTTTTFALVPNGYGGLNWDNVYFINQNYLAGSGYDHGTVSATNAAFNGFGNVAAVVDPIAGEFFNFNSVDLTSAWIAGLQVRLDGYNTNVNAAVPLYSSTVTVNPTGPTLFNFPTFLGVNKLTFTSFVAGGGPGNPAGTEFAMDDFKFTTTRIGGGTPEPGTLVLAATGVAVLALAAMGRRRRARV